MKRTRNWILGISAMLIANLAVAQAQDVRDDQGQGTVAPDFRGPTRNIERCQRGRTGDVPAFDVMGEKYTFKAGNIWYSPGAHIAAPGSQPEDDWVCLVYNDPNAPPSGIVMYAGGGLEWTDPMTGTPRIPLLGPPDPVTLGGVVVHQLHFLAAIVDDNPPANPPHPAPTPHIPFTLNRYPTGMPPFIIIYGTGHGPGVHGGHASAN